MNWINRHLIMLTIPAILLALSFPLWFIFEFFNFCCNLIVLWFLGVTLIGMLLFFNFPKIVVVFKKRYQEKESDTASNIIIYDANDKVEVWANGKRIYMIKANELPYQMSFRLWNRGNYQVVLGGGKGMPQVKEANTFDDKISHVDFNILINKH